MARRFASFTLAALLVGVGAAAWRPEPAVAQAEPLRVCADPNNAPFSKADGSGFENAIADLVAANLGRSVTYAWWAQRRGFVRNTLQAGLCDVVISVPAHHFDMAARTRPYYRSTYVAVTRADRNLDISSLEDPRLRTLRIGVHLIGDGGANTPPAHALAEMGIVGNVVGFPIYGDYREDSPPQRLIEAVARGDIDVALAWGPMAGPVAKGSAVKLDVRALADAERFAPQQFTFEIAMGVRRDDLALRRRLQDVVDRRGDDIRDILKKAGVPLLPLVQPRLEIVTQPRGPAPEAVR
jgi:quinoprotein dehydrogenase-associated probable ABC transporter substrate-binding protein